MTNIQQCPKCGSEIKEIPAGVSKKTGKPYTRFLACTNRDCDWTQSLGYSGNTARNTEKTIQTDNSDVADRLNEIDSKLQKIWTQIININEKL